MALSGKCWPRCVAGRGWGRHSGKEHFGDIEVGGSHPYRGRTVPTPRSGDPWPSVRVPGTHSPFTFTRHSGLTSHLGTPRSRETTSLTSKSVLCSATGGFFKTHSDVHLCVFSGTSLPIPYSCVILLFSSRTPAPEPISHLLVSPLATAFLFPGRRVWAQPFSLRLQNLSEHLCILPVNTRPFLV